MIATLLATASVWLFTAAAVTPHTDRPVRRAVVAPEAPSVDLQSTARRPLTASDLAQEPGVYYGKTVRLRSQVSRSFGPHAFVLNDEPLLAAPNVLVLVPDPLNAAALDYMMTVVGVLRPFQRRQLEQEYPWFKADLFRASGLLPNWERHGIPVLVAQSVRTEMDVELVRTAASKFAALGVQPREATLSSMMITTNEPITSLGRIWRSDKSEALAGEPIVLTAVRVERVIDPEFIMVGTDPVHHLVVRLPTPTQSLMADDAVAVSGVIQKTPETWPPMGLGPWQPIYIDARHIDLLNR
jgi:hypothetical protein